MALIGDNFAEGAIQIVQLTFDGVDCGKNTASTTIEYVEDIFDVFYQQDGTQPADKIRTGQGYLVTATFGVITTELLAKMLAGTTAGGSGNSLAFGKSMFTSMRDNEAKLLILAALETTGVVTTTPTHICNFFKAIPMVQGSINYGVDEQRQLEIQFYCFYDETEGAFGYYGTASSVGL